MIIPRFICDHCYHCIKNHTSDICPQCNEKTEIAHPNYSDCKQCYSSTDYAIIRDLDYNGRGYFPAFLSVVGLFDNVSRQQSERMSVNFEEDCRINHQKLMEWETTKRKKVKNEQSE